MALLGAPTPDDYFTDGEPATAGTAQQPAQLSPAPNPGTITGTNTLEVLGGPRRS